MSRCNEHVFIVGFWNCGTTILTKLLSKHPDLNLIKDSNSPNWEAHKEVKSAFSEIGLDEPIFNQEQVMINGLKPYLIDYTGLEKGFGDSLCNSLDGKRRLLKNCRLFFCKELLDKSVPNCKKIVILRNGKHQITSGGYWHRGERHGLEKLRCRAYFYSECISLFFDKWRYDENTFYIKYEDLCNYTMETINDICYFLSLDFNKIKALLPTSLENRNYNYTGMRSNILRSRWNNLNTHYQDVVSNMIKQTNTLLGYCDA